MRRAGPPAAAQHVALGEPAHCCLPAAALPTSTPSFFIPRACDYPAHHIIRATDDELRVNIPPVLLKLGGTPLFADPSVRDPIFQSHLLFMNSPVFSGQTTGQALSTALILARHLRRQPQAGASVSHLLEFDPQYSSKHMGMSNAPGGFKCWMPQVASPVLRLVLNQAVAVEQACRITYPPATAGHGQPGCISVPLSVFPERLLWPAKVSGWQPVGDSVAFHLYTPHITFPAKARHPATKVQLSAMYVMYAFRGGMSNVELLQHPLAVKGDLKMICVPEAVILVQSVLAAVVGSTNASIASALRGGGTPATSVDVCRIGGFATGQVLVYLRTEEQAAKLRSAPTIPIYMHGQAVPGMFIRVDNYEPPPTAAAEAPAPMPPVRLQPPAPQPRAQGGRSQPRPRRGGPPPGLGAAPRPA